MKPKTILFDWDGTLVDTHEALFSSMNDTLIKYNKNIWTYDEWKDWFNQSPKDSFKDLFGLLWKEAYKSFIFYYTESNNHKVNYFIRMRDMLDHLYSKNSIKIGVVSNKKKNLLDAEINMLDSYKYFKVIVGSGDTNEDKPSPKPIQYALSKINESPGKDVWYIGDSKIDIISGNKAGCTTVYLGDKNYRSTPDFFVTEHKDLYKLIIFHTSEK
jgi:phosphoglycolate phosphatase